MHVRLKNCMEISILVMRTIVKNGRKNENLMNQVGVFGSFEGAERGVEKVPEKMVEGAGRRIGGLGRMRKVEVSHASWSKVVLEVLELFSEVLSEVF